MWEKETLYKLQLKKNLVHEYCKDSYQNSKNFDTVLLAKDGEQVFAHRIILAISSALIKSFTDPVESILLPDFNSEIVKAFVEFIYTGQTVVNSENQSEFLAICKEMMVEIPNIETVSKPESENEEHLEEEEELIQENKIESVYVEESSITENEQSQPGIDTCVNENLAKNENRVNAVAQLVIANHLPVLDAAREYNIPKSTLHRRVTKLRDIMPSSSKSKDLDQKNKLETAIEAVNHGMNTMAAARKFGVPKTTLYRWTQKIKGNGSDKQYKSLRNRPGSEYKMESSIDVTMMEHSDDDKLEETDES